jgi:isoprenylcysteine carboxyl methyltransferase (ICMT) family protein YpbQ
MVTALARSTLLVLAVCVERALELRHSRRNAAWAFSQGAIEVGRGHDPVMVALPGLGLAEGPRFRAIGRLGRRWTTRVLVLSDATAFGARHV